MTPLGLALILLSQVALVAGQVFLKKGMNELDRKPRRRGRVFAGVGAGIGLLTVWFLVWMGLLQKMDISYVYPFQGIGPVLMVFAAMVFLREKVDWRTWVGVALIAVGTVLVAINPASAS
ncbi:MAG TPA: EamA family transporter [Planctomycetota bacterium]|nr:EamA family transporter [Planctomycetota bacterium]